MENEYYRIEVDPAAGALKSVYDKQLSREFVDASSPYRFNQYLYVSGGDGETQLVYLRKSLPLANLTVSASSGGRVTRVRKTSYGQVLTYVTSGPHTPSIESEIILFDREKKIEFINRLHKDPVDKKEAVYFAFPSPLRPRSSVTKSRTGGLTHFIICSNGANSAWFTVQHWVKVASPGLSVGLVPIDSPLVTLGDINRGTWPERFEAKSGTIFSYALNNYWHTNFRRVQSGEFVFRYVLTSGRDLEPEDLARLGRSAMTPLELGQLLPNDKFGNPERPLTDAPDQLPQRGRCQCGRRELESGRGRQRNRGAPARNRRRRHRSAFDAAALPYGTPVVGQCRRGKPGGAQGQRPFGGSETEASRNGDAANPRAKTALTLPHDLRAWSYGWFFFKVINQREFALSPNHS